MATALNPRMIERLKNQNKQASPQVVVNVPQQPPPNITVTAAEPKVVVNPAKPVVYETTVVERDSNGLIKRMIHRPVEV